MYEYVYISVYEVILGILRAPKIPSQTKQGEWDLQSLALWQFLGDLVNKKTWSLKVFRKDN